MSAVCMVREAALQKASVTANTKPALTPKKHCGPKHLSASCLATGGYRERATNMGIKDTDLDKLIDLDAMVSDMLPEDTPRPAREVLRSSVAEFFRTGETAVSRVSPATAQRFPGTIPAFADRVHYLACGISSTNQLGYIIRPRPDDIPAHLNDPEDWIELLTIWELVGFVERFPTAPHTTNIEAINHVKH